MPTAQNTAGPEGITTPVVSEAENVARHALTSAVYARLKPDTEVTARRKTGSVHRTESRPHRTLEPQRKTPDWVGCSARQIRTAAQSTILKHENPWRRGVAIWHYSDTKDKAFTKKDTGAVPVTSQTSSKLFPKSLTVSIQ